MLERNKDAFILRDGVPGRYTGRYRHSIPLVENYVVPKPRPFRTPLEQREHVKKHIEALLRNDLIEPSFSPFAAPVLLVPKASDHPENQGRERAYRVCVDYRGLNAICKPQHNQLPQI